MNYGRGSVSRVSGLHSLRSQSSLFALGVLDTDSVTAWGCIGPFLRCAHHDPDLEPTIEAVGVVARELECFPGSL